MGLAVADDAVDLSAASAVADTTGMSLSTPLWSLGLINPIECVGYSYRFERQQGQEDRLTVLLKREKRMWKTQPSPKRVAGNR